MKKLTIEAKVEYLDRVLAFVDEELEAAGCPMKTRMQRSGTTVSSTMKIRMQRSGAAASSTMSCEPDNKE